jgi:Flp pilus assembly protein TadB
MATDREHPHLASRAVPGIGGPGHDARTADGQSALRLHAGIATIAFVLCALVTVIFFLQGATVLGIVFGVVALGCVGVFAWASASRRQARRDPRG